MPMTDAEWADRRDMITWQNQAVAEAVTAERETIRQLALAESRRREDACVFWEIAAVAKRALETFASLIPAGPPWKDPA